MFLTLTVSHQTASTFDEPLPTNTPPEHKYVPRAAFLVGGILGNVPDIWGMCWRDFFFGVASGSLEEPFFKPWNAGELRRG